VETQITKGHAKPHARVAVDTTDGQLDNHTSSTQTTEIKDHNQTASARQNDNRWLFDNYGVVYFQGRNANLYALRLQLRDKKPLVAYRVEPSGEEPTLHTRNFKINPYYTKQGTLDGKIGNDWDVDYVHLQHQEERGYYRPKEGKSAACL
jgi:hypothetical protein